MCLYIAVHSFYENLNQEGNDMLRLKNVSKFYYSKGVIASGFSKVNLELSMGEFVVITGESGRGTSTLL